MNPRYKKEIERKWKSGICILSNELEEKNVESLEFYTHKFKQMFLFEHLFILSKQKEIDADYLHMPNLKATNHQKELKEKCKRHRLPNDDDDDLNLRRKQRKKEKKTNKV